MGNDQNRYPVSRMAKTTWYSMIVAGERRAKLPEGADPKTMLPRKTPVEQKRLIVALDRPVCLSDWFGHFHVLV